MTAWRAVGLAVRRYQSRKVDSIVWLGLVPTLWLVAVGLAMHGAGWFSHGVGSDRMWQRAITMVCWLAVIPSALYAAGHIAGEHRVEPLGYLRALRRAPHLLLVGLAFAGPSLLTEACGPIGRRILGQVAWRWLALVARLLPFCLFARTLSWMPAVVAGASLMGGLRQAWRVGRGTFLAATMSLVAIGALAALYGIADWHSRWLGALVSVFILPVQFLLWAIWDVELRSRDSGSSKPVQIAGAQ